MPEIVGAKDDLVSRMGLLVGGEPLHTLIMVDAFLVLSGAVLTSYVGVSGLVHRMTLDQCFPQLFLRSTKRGSYPLIIMGFMILCISILYLTGGDILSLAGVYTISCLGVMTLFGIGNILLKINRPEGLTQLQSATWKRRNKPIHSYSSFQAVGQLIKADVGQNSGATSLYVRR